MAFRYSPVTRVWDKPLVTIELILQNSFHFNSNFTAAKCKPWPGLMDLAYLDLSFKKLNVFEWFVTLFTRKGVVFLYRDRKEKTQGYWLWVFQRTWTFIVFQDGFSNGFSGLDKTGSLVLDSVKVNALIQFANRSIADMVSKITGLKNYRFHMVISVHNIIYWFKFWVILSNAFCFVFDFTLYVIPKYCIGQFECLSKFTFVK